jgi:hypothetical protein
LNSHILRVERYARVLRFIFVVAEEVIPRGLKPLFFWVRGRSKAETLDYLEAKKQAGSGSSSSRSKGNDRSRSLRDDSKNRQRPKPMHKQRRIQGFPASLRMTNGKR